VYFFLEWIQKYEFNVDFPNIKFKHKQYPLFPVLNIFCLLLYYNINMNMKKIKFNLFISVLVLNTLMLSAKNLTDSIKHQIIKEITVSGINSNSVQLPYVEVTKDFILKTSPVTPADALQHSTGVFLSRDGIWATSVNIRGISEQRLMILVDDDRLLTATDIAGALSTVDMNTLEKIEVIKGAASVIYGSGAMGGVVNFISQRPVYSQVSETHGSVSSGFHTVNKLWTNNANVQISNPNWYLSANASYRTAQNTMTPAGILKNSQFNDASWGMKGGKKFGDNQELLVNYNHFESWNTGLPGGSAFLDTAVVKYLSVKRNQLNGEYIFTELTDNLKKLSIKAYTQNISRDVENLPKAYTRILPSSLNQISGVKAISDWYLNDYNTFKIGAETWIRKQETSRLKIAYPNDTTIIGEQPTPNATMLNAGTFAQYHWVISPHYLTLNAGARLDLIRTENDTSFLEVFKYKLVKGKREYLTANRKILFEPSTSYNLSYAAHVDLEYTPVSNQKFGLSLANAYRAASIEERFKYIDQGSGIHKGNPDLKPENGFFSNLSYSHTNNNLVIKVDFFTNYLFNLITDIKTITTPLTYVNTNIDEALFVGAEIEANWRINKSFMIFANGSYTRARDVNANTFLPMIPPLYGEVTLNYLLDRKLEAAFSVLGAARQGEVALNENPTDGHVIFNFDIHSVPLNLKKSYLQLFAGADNLLNTAYYNHLSTSRGINRLEPGRNIFIKAKWGW